jgi:putative transposase
MSDCGYKIRNQAEAHFITFAVEQWVDVFTRKDYRDIVLESIRHCQKEKGLLLHGWCIMSNHIHLIASTKNNDLSNILRDFKKFTSKQIIKAIQDNQHESRREWMLDIFKAGENLTAEIKIFNFGARIINLWKCTVQNSFFKN